MRLRLEEREPAAMVGMACRFPGGTDSRGGYWSLLESGQDAMAPRQRRLLEVAWGTHSTDGPWHLLGAAASVEEALNPRPVQGPPAWHSLLRRQFYPPRSRGGTKIRIEINENKIHSH